jgi:RES domain-containing protein
VASAWRLTKTRHVDTAWTGEGARRAGGRWNSPGVAVIYASEALSLALVEVLVHLPPGLLPSYSAMPLEYDATLVETLPAADLPADWRDSPPPASAQALGDAWVRQARSAILRVPSVVVPHEWNLLLNPTHPDFPRVKRGAPERFPFDPRLARG